MSTIVILTHLDQSSLTINRGGFKIKLQKLDVNGKRPCCYSAPKGQGYKLKLSGKGDPLNRHL
jgi:hypothetical protein